MRHANPTRGLNWPAPENGWSTPTACPKYDRCSANICPLDAEWRKRTHLKGERVCFYLTEAVKDRAQGNFEGVRLGELYKVVAKVLPDITARYEPIKKALIRAANSGAKMTRLLRGQPPQGG